MIDSTVLGAVVDECSAWASESVVEGNGGGEGEQALQDPLPEAREGAGAVALERQGSLAAPEDALDALADRREMWAMAGLVFAARPEDRRVHLADGLGECRAGIALVADQGHAAVAAGAQQQLEGDVALIAFGRGHRDRSGRTVRGEDRVQPEAPEEPAVAAAIPIVGGIPERGALDRLAATRTLNRGRVDEQQIVIEARALAGEHAHQPLKRVGEPAATLEVAGLGRDLREQVTQMLGGDRQKPSVRRYSHDRLRYTQRDDLRVCD